MSGFDGKIKLELGERGDFSSLLHYQFSNDEQMKKT
jgi:hypothetical protein